MKTVNYFLGFVFALLLALPAFAADQPKDATVFTKETNKKLLQSLNFADKQDFEDAHRGFIAAPKEPIKSEDGYLIWGPKEFDFIDSEKAPDTVNPSLWRVARLNLESGLFKVTDHIYQVRGIDISNMTIIEGNTGLIIIDPLLGKETSAVGLKLYYDNVDQGKAKRPVVAVIYSHSHIDHFGGVKGVINEADVKSGKVKVLAPDGFLEEAVSENVFAGNAMNRRALYMYGALLPDGVKGHVDNGLGKKTPMATNTLIPPTDTIKKTGEKRVIDGVTIEFQMAPGTEAPAEMMMFFPQFKTLCVAEDATHTLHNLYTLRGAKVRDANKWWSALDTALALYGDRTEVIVAQHHWPRWGKESIRKFLTNQRDGYKYLHDQTLRLANMGYTPKEIAEKIKLPEALDKQWYMRGYYGSISHDVKAIYQYYLGWFDGNPANLNPLPPVEASKRYVEFMGGSANVIKQARSSYAKGDYRWVAEVMNHVVFAEPNNQEARNLEADALEQLGYQAESGPWRGFYLTGAQELRSGVKKINHSIVTPDILNAMTPEMVLAFIGVHVNPDKAAGKNIRLNWTEPETGEKYGVSVENSVLIYQKGKLFDKPDFSLTVPHSYLMAIVAKSTTLDKEIASGKLVFSGDKAAAAGFFGMMDGFEPLFPIVTP